MNQKLPGRKEGIHICFSKAITGLRFRVRVPHFRPCAADTQELDLSLSPPLFSQEQEHKLGPHPLRPLLSLPTTMPSFTTTI